MVNWIELIEKNDKKIRKKIEIAIRKTYDFTLGFNKLLDIFVLLSKKGKVYLKYRKNDIDEELKEVKKGDAILIASFYPIECDADDELYNMDKEIIQEIFQKCSCVEYLEDFLKLKESDEYNKAMVFLYNLPQEKIYCLTKTTTNYIVDNYFQTYYLENLDNLFEEYKKEEVE